MVPEQSERPSFATFVAPEAAHIEVLDRQRFAGLTPAAAAAKLAADYHAKKTLEPSTRNNKETVYRRILTDLARRSLDMASVTPKAMVDYRAYLKSLVEKGHMQEGYAYSITKEWASLVNTLFGGLQTKPREGLKMTPFRQIPKVVDHLEMEDLDAMIAKLPERRFQNEHYRQTVHTFLEVAMATAGRWDSIGAPETTFACIDWSQGTIKFPVVKNKTNHTALLTERALEHLRKWRTFLKDAGAWKGDEGTPIMMGPRGETVSYPTVNDALHDLAALAGINKVVTTHVPRKTVGTHVAKENPKMAQLQLGITQKVFERNYNQPTLKDRMDRRDLLPGAQPGSRRVAERIGALYLQKQRGLISDQEFDREVHRGLIAEATMPQPKQNDAAYG